MENPNFIFLKEDYSKIYEICCMVDRTYAQSTNDFRYPVTFARMALEEILRRNLKIKKSEKVKLSDMIHEYLRKNHLDKSDSFYQDYLKLIWLKGNDAVHNNKISEKVAQKVVVRLQFVAHDVLNIMDNLPKYKFPEGNESWINEFNQLHPDFDEFKESMIKMEEYALKVDKLDQEIIKLNELIPKESDIKSMLDDLKKDEIDDSKLDLLQNKLNDLKSEIPDNLQEDIETIKELTKDISRYDDLQNDLNNLNEVKEEYSFIKRDLDSVKNNFLEVEEIKKQITDLEQLVSNFDLLQLNDKISNFEKSLENQDYDSLKAQIDDLHNVYIDYKKIEDVSEKVNDIRDNIARFTEQHLSPEQFDAVRSRSPRLIIKAGPGAGKTRVLVERVQFLVNERRIDPKTVLVITFTEKAAAELKYRLTADGDLTFEQIDQMQIGTIHGFCRTFLRNYVSSGIEVIDDEDNEKKVLFIKKNLERLNLHKYAYIPNDELKTVASKFDEYASFNIDMDELILYIKRKSFNKSSSKINKQYRAFIDSKMPNEDSKFPLREVRANKVYYKIWTNHKRLAIARAYETYLELLDEIKSYDFNLLQIKTRDSLREMNRNKVIYKNILIDEFQDTDITQYEIFELLAEGAETVTYVGDINQSIYWWRGAISSNFKELANSDNGFEVKELLTNYRSPKNIVRFNNRFMVEDMELRAFNQEDGGLFYLNNRDRGEQAKRIVKVIKYLKKHNKIQKYSDVGLLFRSTTMFQIESLLEELKANDIKFHIQGAPDFEIYPEVECVLLLLWYFTQTMPEEGVFKLREFADTDLNQTMFKLADSTVNVLRSYNGSPREFSTFSINQLKKIGIVDEHDLNFFNQLNRLKESFHAGSDNDYTRLDALGLYYELFNLTGYVKDKFDEIIEKEEDIDSNPELLNLGLISRKINDFMQTVDRFNLDELFEFLYTFYKGYSSPSNSLDNVDCVQILTIHKSKGLEFPVVFVCSLLEGGFPKRKPRKEKLQEYPTPKKLKHTEIIEKLKQENKDPNLFFKQEYIKEFKNEEQRILYVGLTRAKSILIVSHIVNKGKKESKEFLDMKRYNPDFVELRPENFNRLDKVKSNNKSEDDLEFSFTSLENYNSCPHKYNLIHNYNFVSPQNLGMRIGTIVHAVLDKINREIMDSPNQEVNMDFINKIIEEAIESNPDLKDNELFLESLNAVINYYPQIGIELCDNEVDFDSGEGEGSSLWEDDFNDEVVSGTIEESEYPFTIPWYDAQLKGSIDLIMSHGEDNISLIDFKTSDEESIDEYIEKYAKQLHFYYMAMDYNSKYGHKKENTSLSIYSLIDNTFYDIDVNEEMIYDLKGSLLSVSRKVNNKEYPQCEDDESCDNCLLKSLCCK